jgi:hypothetical protein
MKDTTPNTHGIPKRLWSKFGPVGRLVYNNVMDAMGDQEVIKHPDTPTMPAEQWQTIRHNAAFCAAFAAKGALP